MNAPPRNARRGEPGRRPETIDRWTHDAGILRGRMTTLTGFVAGVELFFRRDGALPDIRLDILALETELFPDVYSRDLAILDQTPEGRPADVEAGQDIFDRQQFLGAGAHLGVILLQPEPLSNIP